MAESKWPAVGQQALSIAAHASIIRNDIEMLRNHMAQGETSVPSNTFTELSASVLTLLDKVPNLPTLKDIVDTINRIDENTKVILKKVSQTHPASENPSSSTTQKATAIQDIPEPEPEPEPEEPSLEEEARSLGMAETFIERISQLPEKTVRHILDAQRKHMGSTGPANTVAASRSIGKIQSTRGVKISAGTSSKLLLQSVDSKDEFVHEKIYTPLDRGRREIRVVRIAPGVDPSFDISCELAVVSLDSSPSYTALSYTWGNPKDTLPITLNGHRFDVTRNLKRALQRLRTIDTNTTYWIDAICINQVDMDERMHQVQLMRYIFESPKEVVVYLGEPAATRQTLAKQNKEEGDWDSTLFTWTGDQSDIARIQSILQYAQAYADTYPDLPDHRTSNTLMLAMCFIRMLAGDVHLRDIPILGNINMLNLCMMAFRNLTAQPWVS